MPYTVFRVAALATEPYWTLLDVAAGRDYRDEHRYLRRAQAQEVADILNGVQQDGSA